MTDKTADPLPDLLPDFLAVVRAETARRRTRKESKPLAERQPESD